MQKGLAHLMAKYTPNDLARFWSKIAITADPDKCWEWTASLRVDGYGWFRVGGAKGVMICSHRAAYEIANGEITGGMHVLHKCDNPPCCNPAHLFLGTQSDNMRDKFEKGRQQKGEGHYAHKLTIEQVISIRQRYAAGDVTQRQIARETGVSDGAIWRLVHRQTWKSVA